MKQQLVISAIGADQPGIVSELMAMAEAVGCSISDSRMTVLGHEFALVMLLEGSWDAIAKIETQLPQLANKLKLKTIVKRTQARLAQQDTMPYIVQIVALNNPGIISKISDFFAKQNINISDLYTEAYTASHTGSRMFSLALTVSIPAKIQLSDIRERFMLLCDELNLDGMIEPAKT